MLEQHMYMRCDQQYAALLLVPCPRAAEPLPQHQPPQSARSRPPCLLRDNTAPARPLRTCMSIIVDARQG